MITVAIVEDDQDIRESLALLINGTPNFSCVGIYPSFEKALKGIIREQPDVVLMDIGLPGVSGIEGIKILKEKIPEIDILVLTIQSEDQVVFDALCAGDEGYSPGSAVGCNSGIPQWRSPDEHPHRPPGGGVVSGDLP